MFASKNLQFKKLTHPLDNSKVEVSVRGWVDESTDAEKDAWIGKFSDHSLLYFEIHD